MLFTQISQMVDVSEAGSKRDTDLVAQCIKIMHLTIKYWAKKLSCELLIIILVSGLNGGGSALCFQEGSSLNKFVIHI